MKNLFIQAAALLLSQSAIATICYVPTENADDFVPRELCFDFLYLDTHREEVVLKEVNGLLPTVLYPQYVARRNENGYRFISNYEKINHLPGDCLKEKKLNIIIEGPSDNDGYVDESYLVIKADYSYSCRKGVINYRRK